MTVVVKFTNGGPPFYPTSELVPSEFWRKQPDGIADNPQTITVKNPDGTDGKRVIERNWETPVYVGPRADDPEHGLNHHNGA